MFKKIFFLFRILKLKINLKGKIEKTLLGDICEYIKEVYSAEGCHLSIKLSEKTIEALRLEIKAVNVMSSILATPRIKLKTENFKLFPNKPYKLLVVPSPNDKEAIYFSIQMIKRKLRDIIVKGIPTISRAVINKTKDKDRERFHFF